MYKKVCNSCKINKPSTEYHKRTISPDGLDSQCKECRKKYQYTPSTLENAEPKNRKHAEDILTDLGYELYNKDNPVYKQFYQRLKDKGINLDDYPHSLFN